MSGIAMLVEHSARLVLLIKLERINSEAGMTVLAQPRVCVPLG
jgi:hypothetical protein